MKKNDNRDFTMLHSLLSLAIVFAFVGFICASCGGGGDDDGSNTDTESLKTNGLVGQWDFSEFSGNIDMVYIEFGEDDAYVIDVSSYPDRNGNSVSSPISIYGTYSTTANSITIAPDYVADEHGDQIPEPDVDYCWLYAPFYNSVTFSAVRINSSGTELYLQSGGEIKKDPDNSATCGSIPAFTTEMLWAEKIQGVQQNALSAPILEAPADGAIVNQPPTLSCNPVENATGYLFVAWLKDTNYERFWYQRDDMQTSFVHQHTEIGNTYEWMVKAYTGEISMLSDDPEPDDFVSSGLESEWSEIRSFTVQ